MVLYLSHPIRYVEYGLWLWFLTPLIRRLVDWRFGYADPNFVLLAPLLVSGVAGLALLYPNRARGATRVPASFILCGTAIIYAVVIDAIRHPSAETVYGLVDWFCPLIFGLHFYLNWHRYEEYRSGRKQDIFVGRADPRRVWHISVLRSSGMGLLLAHKLSS